MGLTIIEIVDEALDILGLDPSFRTKGRRWLNITLEKLAVRKSFKCYRKTATDVLLVAGQASYALPASFSRPEACFLINTVTGVKGIEVPILEEYDFAKYNIGTTGSPRFALVDTGARVITFDQIPPAGLTTAFRLSYFMKEGPFATDGSADNTTLVFEDSDLLVQELVTRGMKREDDERYGQQFGETKDAHRDYQRNAAAADLNMSSQLDRNIFRGRRSRGFYRGN